MPPVYDHFGRWFFQDNDEVHQVSVIVALCYYLVNIVLLGP
ncbi:MULTISPECIES: hypothetical protein [Bacillus cereus group]|nr:MULTISPECIES: hypothetical protein [Bacillus cereus group]MDA1777966.1 hypothetical protein [Bacillus cereus group sp. BY9-3LC]MDA1810459.1 hypothetical protein [Bacillus cereus]